MNLWTKIKTKTQGLWKEDNERDKNCRDKCRERRKEREIKGRVRAIRSTMAPVFSVTRKGLGSSGYPLIIADREQAIFQSILPGTFRYCFDVQLCSLGLLKPEPFASVAKQ